MAQAVLDATVNIRYALQLLSGLKASDEEIIAFCDDDDYLMPLSDSTAIERDFAPSLNRLKAFAVAWRARHQIKQDV